MKRQRFFALAFVATLMTIAALIAIPTSAQNLSNQQAPADDPATVLSPPALQLATMFVNGASDSDMLGFISNYSSTFGLTAQSIVYLQQIGVSSNVTIAMLNHDLFLNDNPGGAKLPIPLGPPEAPQDSSPPSSLVMSDIPLQSNDYYSQPDSYSPEMDPSFSTLSQYGSWNFLPGGGWYWQPAWWLGYFYYPWGLASLQNGCWCRHPKCGWIWFPNCKPCANQNTFVAQRQVNQTVVQAQSHSTISHHSTMMGQTTGAHHGHR